MFLLGRNLFLSQYAGLVAAWLLAVMPAHFCYSQVAHGYSSSILLSILALLFAKRAVDLHFCASAPNFKILEYILPKDGHL